MAVYYNDNDPYCAAWLRNLIAAGHLPAGDVDERDIQEVSADDVRGYTQAHFFAGIGGWPYALRLAGWPDDRHVWTGSCPCQPLSLAGQRKGHADQRHLWPAFHRLIAECSPATLFGEQVASRDGREWLAAVRADLEHLGYAVGAADMPAAGVQAPHIRSRLWFVADRIGTRLEIDGLEQARGECPPAQRGGALGGMADDAEQGRSAQPRWNGRADGGAAPKPGRLCDAGERPSPLDGFWRDADWLLCRDERWRPVEPGTFPLAHGVSKRMAKLRAFGNAIVPWAAAEFVMAANVVMSSPYRGGNDGQAQGGRRGRAA